MTGRHLDIALERGYFRMHQYLFTCQYLVLDDAICPTHWLRIDLHRVQLGKSQRQLINRNKAFTVSVGPLSLTAELTGLYANYRASIDFDAPETIGQVRANAYDLVINGVEIGGGSIRIHDRAVQARMFSLLGFTDEEAQAQFGFLLDAFEYGAPPHGGLALGFDRLCSLFGGSDSIRDFIAFPKNNSGRDVMIDSPSPISDLQLKELSIRTEVVPK